MTEDTEPVPVLRTDKKLGDFIANLVANTVQYGWTTVCSFVRNDTTIRITLKEGDDFLDRDFSVELIMASELDGAQTASLALTELSDIIGKIREERLRPKILGIPKTIH